MLEYWQKDNRLIHRFQVANNIIKVRGGRIRMNLVKVIVRTVFTDEVFTQAFRGLVKKIVLGPGKVDYDAISVVFGKCCESGE